MGGPAFFSTLVGQTGEQELCQKSCLQIFRQASKNFLEKAPHEKSKILIKGGVVFVISLGIQRLLNHFSWRLPNLPLGANSQPLLLPTLAGDVCGLQHRERKISRSILPLFLSGRGASDSVQRAAFKVWCKKKCCDDQMYLEN